MRSIPANQSAPTCSSSCVAALQSISGGGLHWAGIPAHVNVISSFYFQSNPLAVPITDDLGEEGVLWRPRRVREFLEAALREGWCCRVRLRRASGKQCSNFYYSDPYRAVRWLDAHPDWVAQQSSGLPEALGVSEEMIDQCRAGTSVYVVYRAKLAVMEPGLLLAEIHKRCAAAMSLPATWVAFVGNEEFYDDYRAKAGDVVEFGLELRIPSTRATISRVSDVC
jgi:hypothetical protein